MWTKRLRAVLRINATSSLIFGLMAAVAAGWVSDTLGIDQVTITRLVGIGLVLFAANVFFIAGRPQPELLSETRLVSAGDAAWVVATVVVLTAQFLSTVGVISAVVVGLAVADFGITQLWMRTKVMHELDGERSELGQNSASIVADGAPSN